MHNVISEQRGDASIEQGLHDQLAERAATAEWMPRPARNGLSWIRSLNTFSFLEILIFPKLLRDDDDLQELAADSAGDDPGYLTLVFGFNVFFLAIAFAPVASYDPISGSEESAALPATLRA